MEDILLKFWPYIEKAGAVAAVILLWRLIKSEEERVDTRKALDKALEARVHDVQVLTQVIERNTAAAASQAQVLQAVIDK